MSEAVIRIVAAANGRPCGIEGEYVVSFDPTVHAKGQPYPTGDLRTSPELAKAKRFPGAAEAIAFYQQAHGTRPDGRPNRPLTAFTVEISRPEVLP